MNFLNINDYLNKTTEQLFSQEKKFRPFFIAFFATLLGLFSLYLTSGILSAVFWPQNSETFKSIFERNNFTISLEQYLNVMAFQNIAPAFVQSAILLGCLFAFAFSLKKCYKLKNLSKLSSFPTLFVGFIAIFGSSNLIFSFISGNFILNWSDPSFIINFVATISTILIWFFVSRYVTLIRRFFQTAEQKDFIQQLSQNFQKNSSNPFSANANSNSSTQNNEKNKNENNVDDDIKNSPLWGMKISEIRLVAEKLSISGTENMKKEELIKTILNVTSFNKATEHIVEEEKEEEKEEEES
ncbi:MAG: Rho termination factor N-terminal domain-containing protein [Metamycoplasmataceae bacterium]